MYTLVFLEENFSREAIEGDVAWDSPVQVGSQRQQVAPSTKLGPKLHATPRQEEQNILLADFIYLSLELLLACYGFFAFVAFVSFPAPLLLGLRLLTGGPLSKPTKTELPNHLARSLKPSTANNHPKLQCTVATVVARGVGKKCNERQGSKLCMSK